MAEREIKITGEAAYSEFTSSINPLIINDTASKPKCPDCRNTLTQFFKISGSGWRCHFCARVIERYQHAWEHIKKYTALVEKISERNND